MFLQRLVELADFRPLLKIVEVDLRVAAVLYSGRVDVVDRLNVVREVVPARLTVEVAVGVVTDPVQPPQILGRLELLLLLLIIVLRLGLRVAGVILLHLLFWGLRFGKIVVNLAFLLIFTRNEFSAQEFIHVDGCVPLFGIHLFSLVYFLRFLELFKHMLFLVSPLGLFFLLFLFFQHHFKVPRIAAILEIQLIKTLLLGLLVFCLNVFD